MKNIKDFAKIFGKIYFILLFLKQQYVITILTVMMVIAVAKMFQENKMTSNVRTKFEIVFKPRKYSLLCF